MVYYAGHFAKTEAGKRCFGHRAEGPAEPCSIQGFAPGQARQLLLVRLSPSARSEDRFVSKRVPGHVHRGARSLYSCSLESEGRGNDKDALHIARIPSLKQSQAGRSSDSCCRSRKGTGGTTPVGFGLPGLAPRKEESRLETGVCAQFGGGRTRSFRRNRTADRRSDPRSPG